MTTRDLIRDVKAQRAAIRDYAARAAELDQMAAEAGLARLDTLAAELKRSAWIAWSAARAESEPDR